MATGTVEELPDADTPAACTPRDFTTSLKWDAEKKTWVADDRIKNINESGECEPSQ